MNEYFGPMIKIAHSSSRTSTGNTPYNDYASCMTEIAGLTANEVYKGHRMAPEARLSCLVATTPFQFLDELWLRIVNAKAQVPKMASLTDKNKVCLTTDEKMQAYSQLEDSPFKSLNQVYENILCCAPQ